MAELGLDTRAVPLSLVEVEVNEMHKFSLIETRECLDKMKKPHFFCGSTYFEASFYISDAFPFLFVSTLFSFRDVHHGKKIAQIQHGDPVFLPRSGW